MDYDYIESLVKSSKNGDEKSKEKLLAEFKPFIINISKRTFINGYEFEDVVNECYKILMRCISLYKIESHRFVAYASNGIKNSINSLIRSQLNNNYFKLSKSSLIPFDHYIEQTCISNLPQTEDLICSLYDMEALKYALSKLTEDEKDLIRHIFFEEKTLKSYTDKKGISYSCGVKKKKYILDKLYMQINIYNVNIKKYRISKD